LWPVIKLQGDATSVCQTVASDGGGKSQTWPLITLLLRTFVIGLGTFLKFQKNRHIAVRKLRFRFGSALKPAVFGLVSKTVTALHYTTLDPSLGLCIGQPVRQALALACEGSIRHPMRKKEKKERGSMMRGID